jgi:hypothetical protein
MKRNGARSLFKLSMKETTRAAFTHQRMDTLHETTALFFRVLPRTCQYKNGSMTTFFRAPCVQLFPGRVHRHLSQARPLSHVAFLRGRRAQRNFVASLRFFFVALLQSLRTILWGLFRDCPLFPGGMGAFFWAVGLSLRQQSLGSSGSFSPDGSGLSRWLC